METLEQLKAIVENAPEGATCIEIPACGFTCDYFKVVDFEFFFWWNPALEDWVEYDKDDLVEIRSLSDIKLIIEQMEKIKELELVVEALRNRK